MSRTRFILSAAVLASMALPAAPAHAAGCAPTTCMPKTGDYGGPNPQKLVSSFGSTAVKFTVVYRKAGKKTKSTYGNTVTYAGMYARYTCKDPSNPWVESPANFSPAVAKIDKGGKGRVVVPASGSWGVHTWTFKFTRDRVTGHVSGTYRSSSGEMCKLSTDFKATLKRK